MTDFDKGYADAVKALKQMLNGGGQPSASPGAGSGSGTGGGQSSNGKGQNQRPAGTDGTPMQIPQLNDADQRKADKNSASAGKVSGSARKEAQGASTNAGGFLSQDAGAEIAKAAGYTGDYLDKKSDIQLEQEWKEVAIKACSANNNPGLGSMVTKIKNMYLTTYDWKGALKKYIGRALSHINADQKYGNKKWLAMDEIKKKDKPRADNLSDIVFLIDCSGSVSDDLLRRLVSECYTICYRKEIEKVTYAYYDDGIRQVETNMRLKTAGVIPPEMVSRIKTGSKRAKPQADVHGRGGNMEQRTLDDLLKMIGRNEQLELVMWFTDGYTNNIPERPKKNIKNMIWVVYDNIDFETKDGSPVIHIKSSDLGGSK